MKRRLLPALFAIALLPSVIAQQANTEPAPDPDGPPQYSSGTDAATNADSTTNPGTEPDPEIPYCSTCDKSTGETVEFQSDNETSCPDGSTLVAGLNSVNFTIGIGSSYYSNDDFIKRDKSKHIVPFKGYNPPTRGAYPEMPSVMGRASSKTVTIRPVTLTLRSKTINSVAFTPAALQLFGAGQGTVVKKIGGVLRQIRTDQCLTDIITTANGYDVKIYDAATVTGTNSPIHNHGPNMTPAPTGDILYQPDDNSRMLQHIKIYPQNNGEFALEHINYTSSLTSPRERIYVWQMTGTYPNHTAKLSYYGRANNVTKLFATNSIVSSDLGDGLIQRLRTIKITTNDQTAGTDEEKLVTTSVIRDKYRDLGGDMLRIFESTRAPGTEEEMTTTYTYLDSDAQTRVDIGNARRDKIVPFGTVRDHLGMPLVNPPAKKSPDLYLGGRMTSMQRSDGYWETYTYAFNNATQSMNMEVRSSWKNEPFDSANARVRSFNIEKYSTRLVEKIAGTIVSDVRETISGPDTATSGMRIITKVTRTGADTPPIIEEAGFYPWSAGVTYGRLAYNRHRDGALSRYTYTTDAATNALIVTEEHGVINPTQSAPEASGPLVGNFTAGIRKVTTRNLFNIDSSEKTYDIASNLLLSQWDAMTFDANGRPTKIIYNLDQTDFEETAYNCCGIASRRLRDGTSINYTRDYLGREIFQTAVIGSRSTNTATTFGIETINGRTFPKTTRTRSVTAAGNSMSQFLGQTITNLAGQPIISRSADANGDGQPEETTYTRNVATRTISVTGPDGITSTSALYTDSLQHTSVTTANIGGTAKAITPLTSYDYTLHNLNGGGIKTTVTQSVDSVILKTSSTYSDQAGRTIKTESPGCNGAVITSAPSYDERSRTIGQARTGQPAVKYTLNLQGETTEVWTDANGDGEFNDAAPGNIKDTCQKSATDFIVEDGKVCQRTIQSVRTDADTDINMSTTYTSVDGLYHKIVPLAETGPITTTTTIRPNVAEGSRLLAQSTARTYLSATSFLESSSTTILNEDGTSTTTQTTIDVNEDSITTASSTSDLLDRIIEEIGERGFKTTYSNFTAAGQPLLTTHNDLTQTCITLDAAARPIKVETLDSTGAVKATRFTNFHPDGQVAAEWGDLTYPTYKIYNIQGQMEELRTFTNIPAAQLNSATLNLAAQSGYEKTNWNYEPATGLLISKRYADGKGPDYTYTTDGKMHVAEASRLLANSTIRLNKTHSYNTAGQLTGIDYNDTTPDVIITYNRLGQKKSVTNTVSTTVYGYDPDTLALDTEAITHTLPSVAPFTRVIDRSQDDLGRSNGFQVLNGNAIESVAEYNYNPGNARLATVSGGAFVAPSQSFSYNYISNSSLIHTVTGPAHTVTNTYEPNRNVLLSKANTRNSDQSVISSVNYLVNTIGQRKERTTTNAANNSATTEWDYDTLGQVASEDKPGTTTDRAYQYDTIGNRKKSAKSLTLPTDDNYASNALNQYTGITSDQLTSAPQSDFDGNMTNGPLPADPSILALFIYDGQNRLLEVRNATTGITLSKYYYDAFSRRIASTSNGVNTIYLYNAWNVVAEYTANITGSAVVSAALSKINLWGSDLSGAAQGAGGVGGLLMTSIITNNSYFPAYDGNGNITEYIDQAASVTVHFDYDAFGNITNQITNNPITNNLNYRFSTKPTDSTVGLYYYGYRFYDPVTGRWINRDPIEEDGGKNLYGFVGNDGVGSLDVLGEQTLGEQFSLDDIANMLDSYNKPGPYAQGQGIPFGRSRNFGSVRYAISLNGICHSCGASGATIPDHNPAISVDPTRTDFLLYPHCRCCSGIQARLMRYNVTNDRLYSSAANVRNSFTQNTSSAQASGAAAAAIIVSESARSLMLYMRAKRGEKLINDALQNCAAQRAAQGNKCCGCCKLYIASDYEYMGNQGRGGSWWLGPAIGDPTPGSGNLLPYEASGTWSKEPCEKTPRENSTFYPEGRGIHTTKIEYKYISM